MALARNGLSRVRRGDFTLIDRSLAHIIHDGSSRNRGAASRDRRTEPRGPEAYSCSTLKVEGASPPAEARRHHACGVERHRHDLGAKKESIVDIDFSFRDWSRNVHE